jgi:hypothetical protein
VPHIPAIRGDRDLAVGVNVPTPADDGFCLNVVGATTVQLTGSAAGGWVPGRSAVWFWLDAGTLTFTAGVGVTLEAPDGLTTTELGRFVVARYSRPNLWSIDGCAPSGGASVWLPATAFVATAGAPNLAASTTIDPTWRFDGAASEWVGTQVMAPRGWGTMRITAYWCNTGTGTGSVIWRSSVANTGPGEVLNAAPVTGASITVAAPTVANQVVATVLDDDVAVTAGEVVSVGVNRFASGAGDTLAGDAALVGVLLESVS